MTQESNQNRPDTWPLHEASRHKIPGGCAAAKPAPQTRMNKKHPESRTRGLHVTKTVNHTRGLRSRQAGFADPDEQKTPRVTDSGAARHQDGKSYPGAAQPPSRLRRPG